MPMDVRTLADIVEAEMARRRVQGRVLGAFAAMAFLLAGIGIHGLLAFAVSNRAREIGLRIALGARPFDVVGMVPGVGLAYAAGRARQALLAGLEPGDPPTFAAAVIRTV
jgi:ABC-type antimicrobial peptide transport system permease subunit